jgi:hypothetical protein
MESPANDCRVGGNANHLKASADLTCLSAIAAAPDAVTTKGGSVMQAVRAARRSSPSCRA